MRWNIDKILNPWNLNEAEWKQPSNAIEPEKPYRYSWKMDRAKKNIHASKGKRH